MANVDRKDLERALNAADFPAGKDELLAEAEGHGAGEDVLRAVRSLAPVEYGSFQEVLQSVTPTVTSGYVPTPTQDPEKKQGSYGVQANTT